MTTAKNDALVQCFVDGVKVPYVMIPMCRVCRSASRRDVEIALAEAHSYGEIAAMFPDSGLSARNIAEHYRRGHLPLKSNEVKEIVAAQAAENQAVVQVAVDRQVEPLRRANTVVQRAQERSKGPSSRVVAEHGYELHEHRSQARRSQFASQRCNSAVPVASRPAEVLLVGSVAFETGVIRRPPLLVLWIDFPIA
ncbi:MAG TPA: hypothetical protein VK988_22380 [Acidimicrobiales bacterium]|nr:hypothetical protein [Acidimicrobiales bacterium]